MPLSTRTPGSARLAIADDPAGRRQEAHARILRADADLDRVSGQRDVLLSERERLTGGDPELLLDEIETRHRLGDRVLDL